MSSNFEVEILSGGVKMKTHHISDGSCTPTSADLHGSNESQVASPRYFEGEVLDTLPEDERLCGRWK